MVLQPFVWTGTALYPDWQQAEVLQKPPHAPFSYIGVVPVWFFGILYDDVWQYGIPDMACGIRRAEPAGGGEASVDDPCTMGLGLHGRERAGLGGPVQLWILRSDADFGNHRSGSDGPL